jgi:hypothetical protein
LTSKNPTFAGHKPLVWYRSFLCQAASWKTARRAVVRFYNKRGTAEQWIRESKQAVKMRRLSCRRFRWKRIENWSLTSLQQRLVKTGGRLVKHARRYWLTLAESHLPRRLCSTSRSVLSDLSYWNEPSFTHPPAIASQSASAGSRDLEVLKMSTKLGSFRSHDLS